MAVRSDTEAYLTQLLGQARPCRRRHSNPQQSHTCARDSRKRSFPLVPFSGSDFGMTLVCTLSRNSQLPPKTPLGQSRDSD